MNTRIVQIQSLASCKPFYVLFYYHRALACFSSLDESRSLVENILKLYGRTALLDCEIYNPVQNCLQHLDVATFQDCDIFNEFLEFKIISVTLSLDGCTYVNGNRIFYELFGPNKDFCPDDRLPVDDSDLPY